MKYRSLLLEMNSLFSQSFDTSGCLFNCGDNYSQSVLYALIEPSQTTLPEKTRNKQNINFQLKRIELGPKPTKKKSNEVKYSRNAKKISLKGLLYSLEPNKDLYLDSHQNLVTYTECDFKADTAYFNYFLSRTNIEEQLGTNNQKSSQLQNKSLIIKNQENQSNAQYLGLHNKQLQFYIHLKNLKLGAELQTLRSYESTTQRNNEYTSKTESR